jgi:AcrR family transcriptional regulator
MPYPAKTNAQTILAVAIEYLEQYGEEALSMRELASRLGLSPRALYHYYADRAALEVAMSEEGFRCLYMAQVDAVGERVGKDAIRASATAYLTFARDHPAWYALLMRFHVRMSEGSPAGHMMWLFVLGLMKPVVGTEKAASATVALWAFMHGFIQLESAAILGDEKPVSGFQVGLEAFLSGLTSFASDALS